MEQWIPIVVSTVVAATPLIIAALGVLICERAGVLNFYAPGTFEEQMPMIVDWYRENPPKNTD